MHKTSGRWQLGLVLTLTTAVLWGALPIALKGLLHYMDAITITWLRFVIAALVLGGFLFHQRRLPALSLLKNRHLLVLMLICVLGLLANYILYMVGLSYITPEGAQVMIQTAPMLLLIGGLLLFKEEFNPMQWLGLLTFVAGLVLFFNQRFEALLDPSNDYSWGILLVFIAGVVWAAYALAQKQLLKNYASEQIMVIIYLAGALLFLPGSAPDLVFNLDWVGWLLLAFCGANTLIAYGAFAEALEHWEASRVSATLAITPLLTLGFMEITEKLFPGNIQGEPLNYISMFGAAIVVAGSATTALSKKKPKKLPSTEPITQG